MNTVKRTKLKGKHTTWIFALALAYTLTATITWMTHRGKGGIQIVGDAHYADSFPLERCFDYHQMDRKWAGNLFGEVKDTTGPLGCLTCCTAISPKGQGIYDYTPERLNQLFNDHGVYNESSVTIWKNLEEAPPGVIVDLSGQISSALINRMIEQRKYFIVEIRRKNGAVYWIMFTGTEEDSYDITATDPIDGYVHLSDYANIIYSVRVVIGEFY